MVDPTCSKCGWEHHPAFKCFGDITYATDTLPPTDEALRLSQEFMDYLNENPPLTNAALRSQVATLQARGDRLAGYVKHNSDCASETWGGACDCGRNEVLTEWRKGC